MHEPLKKASVAAACKALKAEGVEAVAVCFLHAYANPEHERVAGAMIKKAMPGVYLSLSHDILREYREFERMSTTVVNAYIGPKVGGYVKDLKSSLGGIGFKGDLSIMRSQRRRDDAGGRDRAAGGDDGVRAGRRHHRLGAGRPGAGLRQRHLVRHGRHHGEGEPHPRGRADAWRRAITSAAMPAGHPVMLPMIDVVEVGAGGGSIAWLDDIGALKVGPQSAGADPGPDLLSRRRHRADHHRRQCGARPARPGQFPRRHHEARRRRRAARHQGEDRRAAEARHGRGGAGDRRYRHQQDVARGARGVGRQGLRPARLRAGGVGRRGPAACLRHRARALHPDRDRAAVPLAFLGARHAARRRAPRLHPHGLFRSRQRRFRQAGRRCTTRWWRRPRPSLRHGKDAQYQIQSRHPLCRARSSRCRCRSSSTQLKTRRPQGDPHRVRRALRAPLRAPFAGRAGRDGQHPARRHRQAAEAEVPEPRRGGRGDAGRRARRPISPRRSEAAARPRSIAARRSAPARRSPARRSSRSTAPPRCCSRTTRCQVRRSGELIITIGAAR